MKASLQPQKDQELQQVPKISGMEPKKAKVLTDKQFRDKLERLGFNLKEMHKDGNCLFRSLAEFTKEGEEAYRNTRNLIYQ